MRKNHLLLLLLYFVINAKAMQLVNQEIRYSCKGAGEVYLVWGINNWQLPVTKNLPPGSYVKDRLIYTPMLEKHHHVFSAYLQVEPGTLVDYVFWITKGPFQKVTYIWDINESPHKDYHTYATDHTITLIESTIKVRPKETLSVIDFSYILFTASLIIYSLLFLFKKTRPDFRSKSPPVLIIICSAVSLQILLFLIRPSVLGISWNIVSEPVSHIPYMIWTTFYDVVYVVSLTTIFLLLTLILKKYYSIQLVFSYLFVLLCCFSLIIAVLNIKIVEMLGKPFNYQWLYYSDFLKSPDAQVALSSNITFSETMRIIFLCFFALLVGFILFKPLNFIFKDALKRRISIASVLLFVIAYCVVAKKQLSMQKWNYDRLANPVTAFIESVNPFSDNPILFTMKVPGNMKYKKAINKQRSIPPSGKIKNVIVFVLESTPAEYIETYGGKYAVSPQIKKFASQSITFENIYAHAPATNISMVSLLGSVYPWLSYNSLTEEHPDMKIPSISDELKRKGFRTAFFNSADNRFQKAGEFLANRNFDMIKDCRSNECVQNQFELNDKKWNFMNGKDDGCSGREMNEWILQDVNKPFFCIMWTYQTHYPYFFNGIKKNFEPSDTIFNRYLNALHYDDNVIGNLLENLKQNHLFESTLVLIIGDHGEAFGRHDQIAHGRKIYEENLHVPCIMIHPSFKEERRSEIGGMIDIAPTIMSLLGYKCPDEWQGENLFAKTKNSRVFFFAPWSDYLFGYREGDYKYIYNASKNETEIYDLKNDPHENNNRAGEKPSEIELCHQRMAAWAQYVNSSMDKVLK